MSDSRSCGRCIYFNSITNECGEESRCMRQVDEAMYNSYIEGKRQGRVDTIDEVRKLITSRLKRECNFNYCDDSDDCCEVDVLIWLDKQIEQLKERRIK